MNLKYKERLTNFLKRYGIKVIDDSKRCARYQNFSYLATSFFTDSKDKDVVTHPHINYDTEPYLTVGIPSSKLDSLAEIEATFYNNIQDGNLRRTFELWMEQQSEERRLRHKYPALQNAFEAYSVLLHLAQENPNKFNALTD